MNEVKEKILTACEEINKRIYKRRAKKAVKQLQVIIAIDTY